MKRRFDPTKLILIFLVALVGIIAYVLSRPPTVYNSPSVAFGDRSPTGGFALSYVLDNTGFQTKKTTQRLQNVPPDAAAWLILDPETRFSTSEADALLKWIKNGGTVILNAEAIARLDDYRYNFNDKTPQNPGLKRLNQTLKVNANIYSASFGAGYSSGDGTLPPLANLKFDAVSNYRTGVVKTAVSGRRADVNRAHLALASTLGGSLDRVDLGKGRVFIVPDGWMFCNYGLAKDDNAVLVSNLFRVHQTSGVVYFDQRRHGDLKKDANNQETAPEEAPESLAQWLLRPPVSYALLQIGLALMGAIVLAGRRLGSPVGIPNSGPTTRASQFAGAMGSLLFKVKRPKAAAKVIGENFRLRLARRVGLSAGESDVVLARRAHEISGVPFADLERLLLQSRAPSDGEGAVLRDAQEMENVLRVLEGR